MENANIEKSKIFRLDELIEYFPNVVGVKNILTKASGSITAFSVNNGENLAEKLSRFDMFIQIVEGCAEVSIDGISYILDSGKSIIIPANARISLKANDSFKMISTVLKSGYDS